MAPENCLLCAVCTSCIEAEQLKRSYLSPVQVHIIAVMGRRRMTLKEIGRECSPGRHGRPTHELGDALRALLKRGAITGTRSGYQATELALACANASLSSAQRHERKKSLEK